MRSASVSSVSSISTNMSRSPSPRQAYREPSQTKVKGETSSPRSPPFEGHRKARTASLSRSPPLQKLTELEKKRRRDSVSSEDSYISHDVEMSRERSDSRNTRRRYQQMSPPGRGRRTESRSPPRRERRGLSNDRPVGRNGFSSGGPPRNELKENRGPRARSMSPFSKRLALTQAMNTGP